MAAWFYTDANATQLGPVDDPTLLQLNADGVITARSLVWRDGMETWRSFREVAPDLFRVRTPEASDKGDNVVGNPDDQGNPIEGDPVEVGVCAHSGRVYPLRELLPYGEALVGPEHKEDFVRRLMEGAIVGIADATHRSAEYVGFWWRTLSSLLDYMIKMIPSGIFMIPYYAAAVAAGSDTSGGDEAIEGLTGWTALMLVAYGVGLLGVLAFSIFYETWMTGRFQGTLGKIIIGAKVVNPDGTKLTYKRAFIRWLAKKPLNYLIVWIPSTLGFALVIAVTAAVYAPTP